MAREPAGVSTDTRALGGDRSGRKNRLVERLWNIGCGAWNSCDRPDPVFDLFDLEAVHIGCIDAAMGERPRPFGCPAGGLSPVGETAATRPGQCPNHTASHTQPFGGSA